MFANSRGSFLFVFASVIVVVVTIDIVSLMEYSCLLTPIRFAPFSKTRFRWKTENVSTKEEYFMYTQHCRTIETELVSVCVCTTRGWGQQWLIACKHEGSATVAYATVFEMCAKSCYIVVAFEQRLWRKLWGNETRNLIYFGWFCFNFAIPPVPSYTQSSLMSTLSLLSKHMIFE